MPDTKNNNESITNTAKPWRVRCCIFVVLMPFIFFVTANYWLSVQHAADAYVLLKYETTAELNQTLCLKHNDEIPMCQLKELGLKTGRQVHLIAYIGVEGTGHHLTQRIFRSLADFVFLPSTAPKFYGMMHSRFEKATTGAGGEHIPAKLVQSLDTAAMEMDLVIDGSPSSKVFAFADWSNPFGGFIFSGVDPIDLVELSNRSRHNVSLSIIILHRNWTKIIWSTALSRKFGSVAKKVNELKASAMVLNAQLASVPICSWRTFNIDDYPRKPKEYNEAFAKFLHLDASTVESIFNQATRNFVEKKDTNTSKYDTLWTAEDLSYVHDAFDGSLVTRSMGRLTEWKYKLLAGFDEAGCIC